MNQIKKWWDKNPDYNIGIATGKISGGLVVIDLDEDDEKGKHGYETLKDWQKENGDFPETWQSITGRGGYHLFYIDQNINSNKVGLYDRVDIRGEGGYVVAPPSIHPNTGRRYEWEQAPDELPLSQVNEHVTKFLLGHPAEQTEKRFFTLPKTIPEGMRVEVLVRLVGSLRGKGLGAEAIKAAVKEENYNRCNPPLTDKELEKEIFPALKRGWEAERPYYAGSESKVEPEELNISLTQLSAIEEKEVSWLIPQYIPRGGITVLAGTGGCGKTTVWCAIAAAISSGEKPFLLPDTFPEEFVNFTPEKVLVFSAEDSFPHVLVRRLRKNGADLDNILTIPITDEKFKDVKFNSPFLESILRKTRPGLVIFDPIQGFLNERVRMSERNSIRGDMNSLLKYGEKYGTAFLIIVHTNKMAGVWGRKRIADSYRKEDLQWNI